MKKLIAVLLSIAMLSSLLACDLFSNSAAGTTGANQTTEAAKSKEIKLSDSYTHKDPEGMEYAVRYAYTSGDSQEMKEAYATYYDVNMIAEYWILYADKDDKALAEYDYYVTASDEDAKKFADALAEFGQVATVDGAVVYIAMNEQETADIIAMQMQYSGLASDKASEYAQFWKEGMAYINVE